MNISDEKTTLTAVRCAGVRGINPGEVFGVRYYPATLGPEGQVLISARAVCNIFINRKGRRDQTTNQLIEGRRDVIQLTAWNTRASAPGKGLADVFAKCVSAGKEFFCRAELHSYDGKVFDNGAPVMKTDGTGQLTTRRVGYTVEPGSLILGDDSDKILSAEIAAYTGQGNFNSRPPLWNCSDPNHPDRIAWKQISGWRMAQPFVPGALTYGYAKVETPGAGAGAAAAGTLPGGINPAGVAAAVAGPTFPAGSVMPGAAADVAATADTGTTEETVF